MSEPTCYSSTSVSRVLALSLGVVSERAKSIPEVHTLAGVLSITEGDGIVLVGGSQDNELCCVFTEVHQAIEMQAAELLVHALYPLSLLQSIILTTTIAERQGHVSGKPLSSPGSSH